MSGVVLAFDVGSRDLGMAVGQRLTGTARPLAVVPMQPAAARWQAIESCLREWQPEQLVVGLPLAQDGGEQPMSQRARAFAEELARYSLPVALVDERGSTQEARRRFARDRERGLARRSQNQLDARAAQVILEDYLATHA